MEIIPANISKIHTHLESEGVLFFFSGPFSQCLLKDIIKNLKTTKSLLDTDPPTLRRLITVVIELTQNMMRYSLVPPPMKNTMGDKAVGKGFLVLGRRNNGFFVTCGNRVHKNQVPQLKDKLSHLQNLSREDIKTFYVQQLNRSPKDPDQIGGLGFIEMAKRTSKPIQFEFDPIDDDSLYMSITGHIRGGK